ncbi:MAG TPA: hypothetical protein VFY28_01875 [Candidatus Paceibacterota bacterium]|nr:hypothetical protein [Candidatus Paceibacterota bacterium]
MLQGTIVENSLREPSVLKELSILKSWPDGTWNLHQVELDREQAIKLGSHLSDGPWYMHFWESGSDDVLIVFRGKTFDIKHSDKSTWSEAVSYGKSIGVPEEQLDFVIY